MLASALLTGTMRGATAQVDAPQPAGDIDELISQFSPPSMSRRSLREGPVRDYQGLPLFGAMLYPSLYVGGLYDDNVLQAPYNRIAQLGVKLRPDLKADYDTGAHRTILFSDGDFNIFPGDSYANLVNSRFGFGHLWEADRDLVFKFGGDYGLGNAVFANGLVTTPTGALANIIAPQRYSIFGGYGSALKTFDKYFLNLSGRAYKTEYGDLSTTSGSLAQGYRDNLATDGSLRAGYAFSRSLYSFVEASGNARTFDSGLFATTGLQAASLGVPGAVGVNYINYDSRGFRVVAGVGSDRISLFKGEVYGGFQRQFYDYSPFGSPSSAVYGGKISWFPTRDWTLSLKLDEIYQDLALGTSQNAFGSPAFETSLTANIRYDLSRSASLTLTGGWLDERYIFESRHDTRFTAGAVATYELTRNLQAEFDYNLLLVESSAPGGSLTRNQFSLGVVYKY